MPNIVKNLLDIENNIKVQINKLNITNHPKIIAVSKTFKIDKILPLIEHGHINYGENKVQEAIEKWAEVKKNNSKKNRYEFVGPICESSDIFLKNYLTQNLDKNDLIIICSTGAYGACMSSDYNLRGRTKEILIK